MAAGKFTVLCVAVLALAKYSDGTCGFLNPLVPKVINEAFRVGDLIEKFTIKDTRPNTDIAPVTAVFENADANLVNAWNAAFRLEVEHAGEEIAYVNLYAAAGFPAFAENGVIPRAAFLPTFRVTCATASGDILVAAPWSLLINIANNNAPVFSSVPAVINVELDDWNATAHLGPQIVVFNPDSHNDHAKVKLNVESDIKVSAVSVADVNAARLSSFALIMADDTKPGLHSVKLIAAENDNTAGTDEALLIFNVVPRSGAAHQAGAVLMVATLSILSTLFTKY